MTAASMSHSAELGIEIGEFSTSGCAFPARFRFSINRD